MLWANPENRLLCPVIHLLIFIFMTKHSEGYLFPSIEELSNPPSDRIFTSTFQYASFLSQIQNLFKTLLKRDGPFGTHTLRKTAYLLAVWGGGADMEIMQSARHKTYQNSVKYKLDANALLEITRQSTESFQDIPK